MSSDWLQFIRCLLLFNVITIKYICPVTEIPLHNPTKFCLLAFIIYFTHTDSYSVLNGNKMSLSSKLKKRLLKNNSELNSVTDVNYSSSPNISLNEESSELKTKEGRISSNFSEWSSPTYVQGTKTVGTRSDGGFNRLTDTFYNQPCADLAKQLLGKTLVRVVQGGHILKGCIVETECYLGGEDKASHSYGNKLTNRNEPMYMTPGTVYVYLTYGMYHMINISSKEDGSAVLIRAIQPLQGIDIIRQNREQFTARNSRKRLNAQPPPLRDFELCNGPAKMAIGFGIDMNCNKQDLSKWSQMWIEQSSDEIEEDSIVKCKRIGIDSAGEEWSSKPLRFYIYGNKFVSKKDNVGEISLLENRESM